MATGYRSALWLLGISQGRIAPTAGFFSPLAIWTGGAGASSGPPSPTVGYVGPLAFWLGGAGLASTPASQAGYLGLLGLWLGGVGLPNEPPPFPLGAYSRCVLPGKSLAETQRALIDFTSQLGEGEEISATKVEMLLYSGEDPDPSAMLGAVANTETKVMQLVTGGVEGNIYCLRTSVRSQVSNYYTIDAFLAVVPTLQ